MRHSNPMSLCSGTGIIGSIVDPSWKNNYKFPTKKISQFPLIIIA
jgi:hypothetical protein